MEENKATEQTINYEEAYNKVVAERDEALKEVSKQKSMKDKYASENAEYKRKAEESLTADEKKAKDFDDLVQSNEKMRAELEQMKLEKELLANGFSADESNKLIEGKFAVKDIAEIIKNRVEQAVKSANAESTKNSTARSLVGNGTANEKSLFQQYQERTLKQNKEIKF